MALGTLLAVSAGTQALGSLAGGIGAQRGAGVAATAAERESEFNALVAEREARLSRIEAGVEARKIRREGRRVVGKQRAAAGAAGVDVSKGSPLLMMLDTVQQVAEQASLAKFRGEVEATGLETSASATRAIGAYEARARRSAGRKALIQGILGAGQAVLGGATQHSLYKAKGVV